MATEKDQDRIRGAVRERYAQSAKARPSCCDPSDGGPSCCGNTVMSPDLISAQLGYSEKLPQSWQQNMRLLSACISGAVDVDTLTHIMTEAGFADIDIRPKDESREFIRHWEPETKLEDYVLSASIQARKP
jgi:hypothetical protein